MQASIDFDGTLTGSIAGGGGGGSDVIITPTYHQGKKIADYSIDGNEGAIYIPEIEITKNVLSGVKICEIEGVEIYCPSYGYIDTLGDSNIEQIGGFSEGLNVTPVKVKRVSYTNDVSNGEKIGTLSVGDTSYNVYQKANSNINYSLNEQDTELLWFDGRHIYQITFNATLNSSQTNVDLSSCDIDNILDLSGFSVHNNNTYCLSFPYYENNNYFTCWNFEKSTGELQIYSGSGIISSYSDTYITIRYVKVVTP